jgi:hypothetical protein
MKKQFTIVLLCMLLLTPLAIAQKTTTQPPTPQPTQVDVPVWTIGNYWTYRIDNLTLNYIQDNQTIIIHAHIDDLKIRVDGDAADTYQVTVLPTQLTGDYTIDVDLGDGPVNVTGSFQETTISGTLDIAKADLGIQNVNLKIDGKLIIQVHEQPYFPSFPEKLTFPSVIDASVRFTSPYRLIEFPLEVGNIWGIPANAVTLTGTIDSPWFKTINFFNRLIRGFHLYGLIARIAGTDEASIQQISDILADLFPTVDIAHVMNEYLGSNIINSTEIPDAIFCNNTEMVTVGAGTYNAYNITTLLQTPQIFYAPDAGYIIKMNGHFNQTMSYISDINLELIDTNFGQ